MGQIPLSFADMVPSVPQVKAGRLRALAVTTPQRAPVLPDVPTLAEQGVSGYDIQYWTGLFLPAKTPDPIVRAAHKALVAALRLRVATP